jgi:polysaccharide biosynthesis protein PslJ
LVGLLFQVMGPGFAERALARLIPLGYPDARIVRFIEDDPARAVRLVSTSVDPNSIGGMLAIVFVIAAVQVISRQRTLPLWLCAAAVPLTGLALLLTYSRGAWLGAAAGLGVAALIRYRWMIPLGLLAIPVMIVAGLGRSFLERLWLGFTLQDPATQMRLDEYRNAIAVIREYPLFGVGFGEAPRIDLATGVSSIYLTVGQQTGFLGLGAYIAMVITVLGIGLLWMRRQGISRRGDLMLALVSAFTAALVVGVFDHYFFNIQFPHMAALFWILAGLILAIAKPVNLDRSLSESPSRR